MMRVLVANLRLFYQRRIFWMAYFLLSMTAYLSWKLAHLWLASGASAHGAFVFSVMLLALAAGLLAGNMHRHLGSYPVCFVWPGQQLAWRRFIFLGALICGLVGSVLVVPGMDTIDNTPGGLALALLALFGVYLTVYLIGACSAHNSLFPVRSMWIVGAYPLLGLYGGHHPGLFGNFARVIIVSPGPVVMLSAATATFAWVWLGQQGHPRAYRQRGHCRATRSCWGEFLLERARRGRYEGVAKHVWGTFHAMSPPGSSHRSSLCTLVLLNIGSVIVATYLSPTGAYLLAMPLFIFGAAYVERVPLYETLLCTAGREERFVATIASLTLLACSVVVSVALPVVALDLLQPILPAFEIGGLRFAYAPISLWVVLLLGAAVPVAGLLDLACYDEPWLLLVTEGFLAVVVIIAMHVVSSWTAPVPFVWAFALTVAPWGLCALGVRSIAMESDLVPKRRPSGGRV